MTTSDAQSRAIFVGGRVEVRSGARHLYTKKATFGRPVFVTVAECRAILVQQHYHASIRSNTTNR